MNQDFILKITKLAKESVNFELNSIIELAGAGSSRKYYRIFDHSGKSLIAAYNANKKENRAFAAFSKQFTSLNLPVPTFLAMHHDEEFYLQEDLGDLSLFDLLSKESWSDYVKSAFRESIDALFNLQTKAHPLIDYKLAFPRSKMDKQAIQWDLNYFKYYFLKPVLEHIDEDALEIDFRNIVDDFQSTFPEFFMYRDFQSRNIMLKDNQVYFIDYQGGRAGSPVYDLISLVYQAKAEMPEIFRYELIERYASKLISFTGISTEEFMRELIYYRLLRFLQVLGAYGFRGYFEKKPHFLQSVPLAMSQWNSLKTEASLVAKYPYLCEILDRAAFIIRPENLAFVPGEKLQVSISSFSYKKSIPVDASGNGGGFVFDCRILPNPGREKEYQTLTGRDEAVIRYLKDLPEVEGFLHHARSMVNQGIDNYVSRGFKHLSVNFGCTGGQHRSVYCAEILASELKKRGDIEVHLSHKEQTTR